MKKFKPLEEEYLIYTNNRLLDKIKDLTFKIETLNLELTLLKLDKAENEKKINLTITTT